MVADVFGLRPFVHRRRGRRGLLAVGVLPFGLNLHREGGVSLSAVPLRGGTTVCWGAMRARCERIDGEQDDPASPLQISADLHVQKTKVTTIGPLMVRVGSNF